MRSLVTPPSLVTLRRPCRRNSKGNHSGRPEPHNNDQAQRQDADLLRPAAPSRHMLSSLLKASAEASQKLLMQAADCRDRTRLLSAGGPTAGKSLVAPAGLQATHFCDEDFVAVLHWRLGCHALGDPGICRNFASSTGCECGTNLDHHGDHAVCCPYGPLRIKRHDAIADCLADTVSETGAHVRREAYVKAFSTPQAEAWLDIWAFGALHIQDLLIDVTVRHPTSSAYQPLASNEGGTAARAAEAQKLDRYPSRAGRSITPFAVETWGHLGPAAEGLLQTLASEATLHARRRGHMVTASAFLRRWRATLDAILHRGVAMSLMAARCGLPGRAHKRHIAEA